MKGTPLPGVPVQEEQRKEHQSMSTKQTVPSHVPTVNSIMNPQTPQGLLYREGAKAVRSAIRFAMPYCEGNALTRLHGLYVSAYHVASVLAGISKDDNSIVGDCADMIQDAVSVLVPYLADDFVNVIHTQDDNLGFTRTGKALTPFVLAVRACSRRIHGERKRSACVHDDLVLQAVMDSPTDVIAPMMVNDFVHSLHGQERDVLLALMEGYTQEQLGNLYMVDQSTISRRLKAIRKAWFEYSK